MSRIRLIMLSLLAVFAVGAVASAAAQAEGPNWIVQCHKVLAANVAKSRWKNAACTELMAGGGFDTQLFAGEERTTTSENVAGAAGVFKLHSASGTTIECKKARDSGELIGGNSPAPGTDATTATFSECSVAPKTVAECAATGIGNAEGSIRTKAKTVLVYPKEKARGTKEAYDAFVPEAASNLFAEFTLSGTNCGTLQGTVVKVKAIGTEIEVNGAKRKCGVLAEVGKIAAGVFALTESTERFTEGGLKFPGNLKEAELEEGSAFKRIKCELEAFGGAAEEIGVTKVETIPAEAFGWEV